MSERPIECSHCKKPIYTLYKEIVNGSVTVTEMCSDCPILELQLHGKLKQKVKTPRLTCKRCRTTSEEIQTGSAVGCEECYSVFENIIMDELIRSQSIPVHVKKQIDLKKKQPFHVGRSPFQTAEITSSSQLEALQEALSEALKKENYEQAAWLRDQINNLTGSS
jgi:protein arginine kinase activator